MNKLLALCVAALTATAAFAADALPVFNATLTVGKESRFVLLGADGKASPWLKVGESFAGYTVKDYDAKAGALDLEKDGKVSRVTLAADASTVNGGGIAAAQGTIADATATLDAMHFEKMLDQTLSGVRKQQLAMVRQMMSRMVPPGAEREEVMAFQEKLMETMMSGLSAAEMKSDVAKAYAQVFTKDELQGLAGFYSSPLGQTLAEKTPELTQKMNEVIMPRMMANMPKVQKLAQEFGAQQQAKKAAAAAAAAAANPAPAAPAATPSTHE
jgi:hypothetical protein